MTNVPYIADSATSPQPMNLPFLVHQSSLFTRRALAFPFIIANWQHFENYKFQSGCSGLFMMR